MPRICQVLHRTGSLLAFETSAILKDDGTQPTLRIVTGKADKGLTNPVPNNSMMSRRLFKPPETVETFSHGVHGHAIVLCARSPLANAQVANSVLSRPNIERALEK